ncbi:MULTISPECIES: hypothetical protein [unclassified Paenibacillus]|uniref:hypothetical protein n=1 Tax=unclassified Paenibacillus TaxID=185978 RepID=UPI000956BD11|nr:MULTISPECIES: hypothetical protein [unclassified Paenibacillus]ASS66414.1 hypothetical protein CIC07_09800 [Paenibacillus sp. RUD330]SIQ05084.1 hypothetical protein SAMN05880555_0458 [Paenibacillus sp. RU4X]SIQ25228.1 hypothetical protein SAMN05880570_0458 [Paenibacillus sp. RU4T]
MNRYFYYSFIMVAMLNLMLYVPSVLLKDRMNGAVSGLIVSLIVGTAIGYASTSALARFPGMGLPEILRLFLPEWLVKLLLPIYAFMWFFASSFALIGFTLLMNRVLTPDQPAWNMLLILGLLCVYGATRSALTILYLLEITMLLVAPLVLLIIFKGIRSPDLSWDAIFTIAQYVNHFPTLSSVGAGTFIFTGYINMAIFNRVNPPNFRLKGRWIIPVTGTLILLATFFLPIGFHGTMGVDRYLYVWTQTADSMTMRYGFIERVVFVFLFLYLGLSIVYTITGWNQAMEFILSIRKNYEFKVDYSVAPAANWWICGAFFVLSFVSLLFLNERIDFEVAEIWLIVRMFLEAATVLFLFIISRRRKTPI